MTVIADETLFLELQRRGYDFQNFETTKPLRRLSKPDKFREGFTMNGNTRNEFASYGLEILKRAVLEVLYQQQKNAEKLGVQSSLQPTGIREQLGLPRRGTLIREILMHLAGDGHAEKLGPSGRWNITENGIKVIEGR